MGSSEIKIVGLRRGLSYQDFFHLLQDFWRSHVVFIQNQEREVIRQNLLRVDDVIRVSSYLLHESRDAFHSNKLWRQTLGYDLETFRATGFLHDQELELKV